MLWIKTFAEKPMLSPAKNRSRCDEPWLIRLSLSICLFCVIVPAAAFQLPSPASLAKHPGLRGQTVDVIEPHATTPDHVVRVAYTGIPVKALLTDWFGDAWQAPNVEVVFLAEDGYASAIPATKLASQPAFLAYARADGRPFELENWEQRERVPLAPYYLIWDNLQKPELQRGGSSGWPYQVARVKLRQVGDDAALRLPNADPETLQGLRDTVANCLTCHHLRGFGGEKIPEDLAVSLCRWSPASLQRWIDEPSRLRPGTAMPAINRAWPEQERRQVAARIVRYLEAVKQSASATCEDGKGK